jgi:superfamily II DNA or RNA helicase
VPKVYFVETGFEYDQPDDELMNVQQLVKAMREDTRRNRLILDCLNHQRAGDYVLILGDSLAHLQELMDTIDCLDELPAAFISGDTPKQKRDKIMEDFRAGRYTYLFATYALAKEGLDIPRLNTLILLTPKKDKAVVQQAVGRIMRPFEGKKQPVVYDFYDSNIKQCVFWARERAKVYRNLGCQVEGGPKIRKK